jgi:hypothetical protein
VHGTGSGSCPVTGFLSMSVGPLGFPIQMFINGIEFTVQRTNPRIS